MGQIVTKRDWLSARKLGLHRVGQSTPPQLSPLIFSWRFRSVIINITGTGWNKTTVHGKRGDFCFFLFWIKWTFFCFLFFFNHLIDFSKPKWFMLTERRGWEINTRHKMGHLELRSLSSISKLWEETRLFWPFNFLFSHLQHQQFQ